MNPAKNHAPLYQESEANEAKFSSMIDVKVDAGFLLQSFCPPPCFME